MKRQGPIIVRRVIAFTALAWTIGQASPSHAEEGLFVAKLGGGVSAAENDSSDPGGMISANVDLAIGERTGPVAGTSIVLNDRYDTIGLHLGIKYVLRERTWTRLYVSAAPELLFVWDREGGGGSRRDLALHAGLGYEYLMMWGLGLDFRLEASLPAGLGNADAGDAASVGTTIGLFTEF